MASVTRENGTVVNVGSGGMSTVAWSNPTNAQTCDNGSFATQSFMVGMAGSADQLKATNFGFSIDSGDTIDGIIVTIQKKAQNIIRDAEVFILNGDGSGGTGSTNKADTGTNWPTSEASVTYGTSSEKWGETWTPAKINSSNFGVILKVGGHSTGFGTTDIASVDCIQITVHSSSASGTTSVSSVITQVAGSAILNETNVAGIVTQAVGSNIQERRDVSAIISQVVGSNIQERRDVSALGIEVLGTAPVAAGTKIRFGNLTINKVYQGSVQLNKLRFGNKEIDL
tara:strand:+ start:297 stop:1148 length:852 start_codon:yes stop_codon:yes gene_type:complete